LIHYGIDAEAVQALADEKADFESVLTAPHLPAHCINRARQGERALGRELGHPRIAELPEGLLLRHGIGDVSAVLVAVKNVDVVVYHGLSFSNINSFEAT
jgi:hypothetical protein